MFRMLHVRAVCVPYRCTKIAYACFSYCEHITDAGVELLGQMKSIVHLDVRGCNITDEVGYVNVWE